jgi:energy-coupling factor transporter transmembrane protein EcfT
VNDGDDFPPHDKSLEDMRTLVRYLLFQIPEWWILALFLWFLFWTFTFPANQQTSNWTVLPENWMALRTQWEYSHAASAVLNLIALIALIFSVLTTDK